MCADRTNPPCTRARLARAAGVAATIALPGCAGHDALATRARADARTDGREIALEVSAGRAVVGEEVTIDAVARHPQGTAPLADYTAALTFDTAAVRFVRDATPSTHLHALRVAGDTIRLAGASVDGFRDGVMFRLVLAVARPDGLRTLRLQLRETVDTTLADRTAGVRVRHVVEP
jgi:hypothetical protein